MQKLFQVDAFVTERPFSGNPAAVCPLDGPRSDDWMQGVALEMNLSETAFVHRRADGDWDLRWFTPKVEVDLCGHATLAAGHALWTEGLAEGALTFHTRSGPLHVAQTDSLIELDLPATVPEPAEAPDGMFEALGLRGALFRTPFDYLVEAKAEDVHAAAPDFVRLRSFDVRGVIVTAKGNGCDFISRFFAPAAGVDEDPVTGSAHCALAPFWAERLGKRSMDARQLSARGGHVALEVVGERVKLSGKARTTVRGELLV